MDSKFHAMLIFLVTVEFNVESCDENTYGVNCDNSCDCRDGADKCDIVTGCVCSAGFTGEKCDLDKDECEASPTSPCETNEICVNTFGSYDCRCRSGYEKDVNGNCGNINECVDSTLNTCSQVCTDNDGSFTCSCNPGFVQDGNNCTDLNECEGAHECEQVCTNIAGSYRCSCFENFQLNEDRKTCSGMAEGEFSETRRDRSAPHYGYEEAGEDSMGRAEYDCPAIIDPENGYSTESYADSSLRPLVSFTCNTGYILSGPENVTCSHYGFWDPEPIVKCSIQDCGNFQPPLNGNVNQSSGTTYGKTVTFSCSAGYEMFGADQSTCKADGKWSNVAPQCQVSDCGGLSSPANGLVSTNQTTFGQVAIYTCNEGYVLTGTIIRTCQGDGSWSALPPTCLVIDV